MTPIRKTSLGVASIAILLCAVVVQAASTDAQKCASAEVKATGKYGACRAKAMAAAVKQGTTPDFAKCDQKLQDAIGSAEAKYGASCTAGNGLLSSQSVIGLELADEMTNLGCRIASPLSGTPGSVLVFDIPDASALANVKMYVKNVSNLIVHARCFATNTAKRCSDSAFPCLEDNECAPTGSCVAGCNVQGDEFSLTIFAQRQVYWYPLLGTAGLPAFTSPSGQIVCVQTWPDGAPSADNSLLGGIAAGDACPTTTAISVVADQSSQNGDTTLNFGPSDEYGSCPSSIDPSLIDTCWSESEFTFVCN